MADEGVVEQKLFQTRLETADKWRALGANPWGNGYKPTHLAADIHAAHPKEVSNEALEALSPRPVYCIAGRVTAIKSFGKAAFINLTDRSGVIQVHVKKDVLGDRYELFKLVDLGDFAGVVGSPFRSKTGELTLTCNQFDALGKALRPLPEKWHGLADQEIRYRQRYLDLISTEKTKDTFQKRTRLVRFIRSFLDARGYVEVETPMMHSLVSGAAARPFTTHHNALNLDLFMRIAPELHLKRLVVGGLDRVYEINRNFRNEGISTKHNPEFTMLEFYEAYSTYEDLMDLTEELISEAAKAVTGGTQVTYQGTALDFQKGWKRIPMAEAIREQVKDLTDKDMGDADRLRKKALEKAEGPADRKMIEQLGLGELTGVLFEQHVESTLIQPTFVTQFPTAISPLARRNDQNPDVTDRFELFVYGREIANAFSELNDPIDQKERFLAQLEARKRGQEETMDYDEDYIRALEHGLPPTAGEGIGIDRLCMLLTDAASIRDVILFPLLKPQR